MEPAVERWNTVGIGLGGHGVVLVAMEPAGDWREHRSCSGVPSPRFAQPQWSPPPTGGKTGHRPVVPIMQEPPQRSPPAIGGSTRTDAKGLLTVTR